MKLFTILSIGILLCYSIHTIVGEDETTPPNEISFQVVQTKEIDLGDHSVIYNRVVPPTLPNPVPIATAPLTSAEEQLLAARAQKGQETLVLSATVYDHEVTALSWRHNGQSYQAFSNIDFNLLTSVTEFETASVYCQVVIGIGDKTRENDSSIPMVTEFSSSIAEYAVVESPSSLVPASALIGIDAIHEFYDANRQALANVYAEQQAAQLLEDQAEQNSQPPRDIIINYWPEVTQ